MPITDRLVSLADPDARPIRKGKAGKPTEFGSVHQIAEITPNTRKGARGFVLSPAIAPGNPGEGKLLPATVAELKRLGLVLPGAGASAGAGGGAALAGDDQPLRRYRLEHLLREPHGEAAVDGDLDRR